MESEREIPVIHDVDVVVVGGSSAAVKAAVAANELKAKVFLVTAHPYLGDDVAGRLRLEPGENGSVPTPIQVKTRLDRALVDAGIGYLTDAFVTDVLEDRSGAVSGVVIADRSGRQAIVAKAVVDATECSLVSRLAGKMPGSGGGRGRISHVVLAGSAPRRDSVMVRLMRDFKRERQQP